MVFAVAGAISKWFAHKPSCTLGDMTLGLTYEAFDGIKCIWKVRDWRDLIPAAYFGVALTVPTGISPYDDVANNFDITGRGFYRLDGTSCWIKPSIRGTLRCCFLMVNTLNEM